MNKFVGYDGQCIVMNVLIVQVEYSLWEENVLVPGCSGGRCSVAQTRRQQLEERVGWVCGVQSDFLSTFPHSGGVKILEVGQYKIYFSDSNTDHTEQH